jgi:hypothetical protein
MVEPSSPVSMNWIAMAHRIRPRTRTTITIPIRPNALEITVVSQKAAITSTQTPKITPIPTKVPVSPKVWASSA